MNQVDRQARNQQRLSTLFPTFAARNSRVIHQLEGQGIRPRIQNACRSPADQKKAFKAGHSKLLFGFHNVTGEEGQPERLAVDLLDDDAPLNPGKPYILKVAASAQAETLLTEVRWGVPQRLRRAIDDAIASEHWDADVKIGWDPLHIEPPDVTVAEARAGKRPK